MLFHELADARQPEAFTIDRVHISATAVEIEHVRQVGSRDSDTMLLHAQNRTSDTVGVILPNTHGDGLIGGAVLQSIVKEVAKHPGQARRIALDDQARFLACKVDAMTG